MSFRRNPSPKRGALVVVLGFLAVGAPLRAANTPAPAGDLEKQLLEEAPAVLKFLRDQGCQNVGVLKFRVKKGQEATTDNAGPLNTTLAQRLELALILVNDVKNPLGIILDASARLADVKDASHLTAEGRRKLFTVDYPLAWGSGKVTPDILLTGVAQISPNLEDMTVGIIALDKKNGGMQKVVQFTTRVDPSALIEAGESFLLRGAFDAGTTQTSATQVVKAAVKVKEKEQSYPLSDQEAPLDLEVRYDNQKVPLQIRDGKAQIPEPNEGQNVSFHVARKGEYNQRFAVVLKVNGENTLYKERKRDVDCHKWVLDPGDDPLEIQGYQLDNHQAEKFRVLSHAESKAREMNYGKDVGTIAMTVFREQKGKVKPPSFVNDDNAEDLAVLASATYPNTYAKDKPRNLSALQEQLHAGAVRGLIGEGEKIAAGSKKVSFEADPVPVMAVTITYYRP